MLALHHFGFSTCSQKVRLVLEEKRLEFESREVNLMAGGQHDPAHVKLNPKHVVPTLVHDGRVLVESSLIIQYLDDAFPEPPMRPSDALDAMESDLAQRTWLSGERFGMADAYFFVDNPLNRYTLSQRNEFKVNADGSVETHLQAESPGKDKESNWLPAPKDEFVLMLRLYWPKEKPPSLIDGSWKIPAVREAS